MTSCRRSTERSRRRPGETVDASHIQSYWQQHVPLVTTGIDAFWPDEGDWFNLFERIKRHQLYYQGHLSTPSERASVESAAQRLPGNCAVGRVGLVGRHGNVLEDARGADRRRHQLFAQHRSVLGLGHRRLLSQQRADRRALRALAPVRRLLRVVPLARPDVVHAPAVGLGAERHGAARVQQHERPDSSRRPAQHPAIGDEQSRDRTRREEVLRAALSADAVHLHAGMGGARFGSAPDARDVAALSTTTSAPGVWAISSCGGAICSSRRCSRKARRHATCICRRASGTTGGRTRSPPGARR